MSVFFPTGVPSLGKSTWTFIIAVAAPAAATVVELNAATGVVLQLAVRPGFGVTAETAKVDDRRLGSNITYQSFGVTTRSIATGTFIDRPQDAPAAPTRKHMDVMVEGAAGFLVNRRGFGSASENWVAWATTQRYFLVPVICGPQTPIAEADEGGQFEYMQEFVPTGPIVFGVVT